MRFVTNPVVRWKQVAFALLSSILLGSLAVIAQTPPTLSVYMPNFAVCPGGGCIAPFTFPGQLFTLDVVASGPGNTLYTGTITFTSSDPLATLPANYTFAAAEEGFHDFRDSTVFRTLGLQTVTVTDLESGVSNSYEIKVVNGASPSIPVTSPLGTFAMGCFLASVGAWLVSRRS